MTAKVASAIARTALAAGLVACGGSSKSGTTTPAPKNTGLGSQSMSDSDPTMGSNVVTTSGGGGAGSAGAIGSGSGSGAGSATMPSDPPITFPNQDPDPAMAKTQVDAFLTVAKQKLSMPTPDPDGALQAAREALKIDAASVDAAAYVAFAYYHKKQYDTAELVLDDVFKRDTAKQNANIYYVYGLIYDHTNRPDQAVLAFKKAVDLQPSFASALIDLGVHQLQNKQYADAQATYEKVTQQLNRSDAVTLTALASAYRGKSGDYPPGSPDRNILVIKAEKTYKQALSANPAYGPAFYDLALLYLDTDPYPSGGGPLDTLKRLDAAKTYLDSYKNMPGVDMKLYDDRMKEVTKLIKRASKKSKAPAAAAAAGGAP